MASRMAKAESWRQRRRVSDEGRESAAKSRKAKVLMVKGELMTLERWTWGQGLGCLDFNLIPKAKTIDEGFQQ